MKKIILVFLLAICATGFAQEVSITETAITGRWEISDIINPELTKDEIEETKSLLESTYLLFNADKTCTLGIIMDLDGTWKLDPVTKEILTTTRRGETTWKIHSLQKDQLVVSRNDAKQKIVFARK